jgi:hypothetical protein
MRHNKHIIMQSGRNGLDELINSHRMHISSSCWMDEPILRRTDWITRLDATDGKQVTEHN